MQKSLNEKFIIHSQEEKASRLDYLLKHLLQKKLKNQVMDIHFVIICLLLRISRNPIENRFFSKKEKKYSPEKKAHHNEAFFENKQAHEEV